MNKCSYKVVENPIIPNTDMKILLIDGVETSYYITPKEGYMLHAKELDSPVFDEESMMETGEIRLGYTTGTKTCHIDYDFEKNPREFYAVPSQEEKKDEKLI